MEFGLVNRNDICTTIYTRDEFRNVSLTEVGVLAGRVRCTESRRELETVD